MIPNKIRILVVDDCRASRHVLARGLRGAGYDVHLVGSGEEAKEFIAEEAPHLIILDWVLPGVSGVELCAWIRQQHLPHYVYTVIVTALLEPGNTVVALEAGADDFLHKPFDPTELLARVRAGVRLVEMEHRLSQAARTDALTGLFNRRTLLEHLEREWHRSRRHHIPLSVAMLDVDYFKRINDSHGHPVGDEVLRRVARILQEGCRQSDIVGRYGGEEFCIVLPETDEPSAVIWAERVRLRIAEATHHLPEGQFQVTASMGVAEYLADCKSPSDLIDLADQALLVAKRVGRDRVINYRSVHNSPDLLGRREGPSTALRGLVARDVMIRDLPILNDNLTMHEAARHLLRLKFISAPVVDDQGKMVGLLSERDVMSTLLSPQWWNKRVREVMKRNVVCYEEMTPLTTIYDFLCRVSLRSVVVARQGRPVGMISRASVVRWFVNRLAVCGQTTPHADSGAPNCDLVHTDFQSHALRSVHAMAQETLDLEARLLQGDNDLTTGLVTSLARIEESVHQLLVSARDLRSVSAPDEGLPPNDLQRPEQAPCGSGTH